MDKQEFLEKLLESYEAYFDIQRNVMRDGHLIDAEAIFHSRSERYVLVKSAKLWAAENNEYVYFILVDQLNQKTWAEWKRFILKAGLSRIKPHTEHMSSYVTLILIADDVDRDTEVSVKKSSYHKDFLFSIKGWMDFKVAAVSMKEQQLYTNRMGKDLHKVISPIFKDNTNSQDGDLV